MGIHICVTKHGKEIPEWDPVRRGGSDHEFPSIIDWDKVVFDNDERFRPTDIPVLREAIRQTDWEDMERFLSLLDLVEQDEDIWIFFSQ